ncbi:MAG: asparagine synthetase B family protein [Deferribacteres bacterium]|nr:asparagine synthetase B family protein [candidate division KSB1 bacterium]MCB9510811.1 asparagine synthetase B family protein [Deferribacteres bacterium]
MQNYQYIERVVDLTDASKNIIYNMPVEAAKELIRSGSPADVRKIDGQFALVSVDGKTVRIARSIGRPVRYFIAKLIDGPCLVIAERIDEIHTWLKNEGLDDQFHPSYTRMAPAHYVTELALLGCPDPNPTYSRFFMPERNSMPKNITEIGETYIRAVYREISKWLQHVATDGPIGVSFSGGIDSGSVFLLTYHAMLQLGMNPSRLKAFTLSIDGGGADVAQARHFLESLNLALFHEPIEVTASDIDWRETIRVVEDYKDLDVQAAAMNLALCKGIRARYPEWRFLLDGDGGDENLKDYPIEENPELTIRSVLNNLMLYQEGWGVESIKHSLTYSGGLSRGYARTCTTVQSCGFEGFSPYTLPNVIEIAEAIPYIELTDWQHDRLYSLKGEIVSAGVQAVTGMQMPVFEKRRFQHGVSAEGTIKKLFPKNQQTYRRFFNSLYE